MAHDYVIISDATCNLPKQFYEDDFAIIPMDVIIDGKAYDADTISKKSFTTKCARAFSVHVAYQYDHCNRLLHAVS